MKKTSFLIILLLTVFIAAAHSEEMSMVDRYQVLKKDPTWPMASSMLVGFGSGQFMTGENNKGLLFAAGEFFLVGGIMYFRPQHLSWQLFWATVLTGYHVWEMIDTYNIVEMQNRDIRNKIGIDAIK
jgi:TM2 domain-containing membrane protein YozV